MLRNFVFVFILGLVSLTIGSAQKVAHINSGILMQDIPEIKQADSDLQAFQTQLQKKGEQMVTALQTKYQEISKKEQAGEISPKQLEEEARKLKEEEAAIGAYEQEMNQKIMEKRQALYKPILDNINQIINEVAKSKGYTMVVDSSTGVLLYADESFDLTQEVKSKLTSAAGTK